MKPLINFFRSSRWSWLLLTLSAAQTLPGADLAYKVTLNGSRPVTDAYVTLQTPGGAKTIVTKTDEWGKFTAPGVNADKILVTIEKNGSMVYRGINKVDSTFGEKVIDLTEKNSKPVMKRGKEK
jgi:hypothetical protein